jgi:SAM-dependent methyltransferase
MALDQVALGNPSFVWRSGQERRLEMVRRYAALEGATVLDIGCGLGAYVRRFSDFTSRTCGIDIDRDRVLKGAQSGLDGVALAVSESLPFADGVFDVVLLNEVIEHVRDDRQTLKEALRVTRPVDAAEGRPGGRVVIFAPNRFYPFETHGIYLGKKYVFGNIPLVNYLPGPARDKLVPHARAYTKSRLEALTAGLDCRWIDWTVVFPGYDNIVARNERAGRLLQNITYGMEKTWLRRIGLSHLLVLEPVR